MTDLDGNPRIVEVDTCTVDMGAYEFQDGDPCDAIPAVSEWGAVVMVLLVLTSGTIVFGGGQRARGVAH